MTYFQILSPLIFAECS